jgi:hypothetical protein
MSGRRPVWAFKGFVEDPLVGFLLSCGLDSVVRFVGIGNPCDDGLLLIADCVWMMPCASLGPCGPLKNLRVMTWHRLV